jgi:hypothetical protein
MEKENKVGQPFLIFLITIILLLLLSLQTGDINIWGVQIRKVDMLSDIRIDQ